MAVFIKPKLPHALISLVEGGGLADIGRAASGEVLGRRSAAAVLGLFLTPAILRGTAAWGPRTLAQCPGHGSFLLLEWGYPMVTAAGSRSFRVLKRLLSA